MEFLAAAFRCNCNRRFAASMASFSRCCFLQQNDHLKYDSYIYQTTYQLSSQTDGKIPYKIILTLLLSFVARPIRFVLVDTFRTIFPHFAVSIRMVSPREAEWSGKIQFSFIERY